MKVVGFNYTRMSAERSLKWDTLKNINANLQFTEIEKEEASGKDQHLIRVSFKYEIKYEPKNATILLEGIVLLAGEEAAIKEILKQWSKKKEVSEELQNHLFQVIWRKSNLKAFQLEDELNIIPHLQLPQVKLKPKD